MINCCPVADSMPNWFLRKWLDTLPLPFPSGWTFRPLKRRLSPE